MDDLGVIDQFTNTFSQFIDTGFGLLRGEVSFLSATLIVIDITLAGLLWAMGGTEDVIASLIKKTLYVGVFAYIITNFNTLSRIIFQSFAGLGLVATGSTLSQGDLLRPGRLAAVGVDAGRLLLHQIGVLSGFPDVFHNLDSILVLFLAWVIVILAFFILAVQLFVTLIEFKLTTLAGFILVPFALWNRTAFLAERVLGNVVSSGVKVLVLAVIVGIGTGIFGQFTTPPPDGVNLDYALAIMLASIALFGLGIFGPGIANGLVSGAPQLGAGAAAGTALAVGGLAVAGGAAALGGARLARDAVRVVAGSTTPRDPPAPPPPAGGDSPQGPAPSSAGPSETSSGANPSRTDSKSSPAAATSAEEEAEPDWASRLKRRQQIERGVTTAAHAVRSSDRGASGANPDLSQDE
jgi:type IV secretion system protein TrbL